MEKSDYRKREEASLKKQKEERESAERLAKAQESLEEIGEEEIKGHAIDETLKTMPTMTSPASALVAPVNPIAGGVLPGTPVDPAGLLAALNEIEDLLPSEKPEIDEIPMAGWR